MNRFRDPLMRKMYDGCVALYRRRGKDLFYADGRRCYGNGFAGAFWRGFDGMWVGRWDAASRKMVAYACWRAGQDMAREQGLRRSKPGFAPVWR